jgi:hypothetical protein
VAEQRTHAGLFLGKFEAFGKIDQVCWKKRIFFPTGCCHVASQQNYHRSFNLEIRQIFGPATCSDEK